jgi:pentatricopeptide repeat protein
MTLSVASSLFSTIREIVSPLWTEFFMFGLAAFIYVMFTSSFLLPSKNAKKKAPTDNSVSNGLSASNPQKKIRSLPKVQPQTTTALSACSAAVDDVIRQAKLISSLGKDGNLQEVMQAFQLVKKSGAPLTPFLYNCLMEACIKCNDVDSAIQYFAEMKASMTPDIASFNTVMKGYLIQGNTEAGFATIQEMKATGIIPPRNTFHALCRAVCQKGDRTEIWRLVEAMKDAGYHRSIGSFACSMLLKGVTDRSQAAEFKRIIALIDAQEQPDNLSALQDDTTFEQFIQACLKVESKIILWDRFHLHFIQQGSVKVSAPTCGLLIKAYGQANQLDKCWLIWQTAIMRKVKISYVTLGCMVEALVANYNAEDAWKLVNQIWEDTELRPLVNNVVYAMLLKGFTMMKKYDKVIMVYHQMTNRSVQCNTIAYNTMLNALALCGHMEEVPKLLEDMRLADPPVLPDIITYSTIIKGFCMAGQLDQGLELLKEVKKAENLKPDEVMYNSLLDGCAKQNRLDTALDLLDEMKLNGIALSNYTLSIVCKLMGRAKKVNEAAAMVESTSKMYGFRPNIQVYTCLIQAFIYNGQFEQALALYSKIANDPASVPDEKTFTVMARGFLQMANPQYAEEVVRCAFHLPGHSLQQSHGKPKGVDLACVHDVVSSLGCASAAGKALTDDLLLYRQLTIKPRELKAAQFRKPRPVGRGQ